MVCGKELIFYLGNILHMLSFAALHICHVNPFVNPLGFPVGKFSDMHNFPTNLYNMLLISFCEVRPFTSHFFPDRLSRHFEYISVSNRIQCTRDSGMIGFRLIRLPCDEKTKGKYVGTLRANCTQIHHLVPMFVCYSQSL